MAFWESFFIILGSVMIGLILSLVIIYGITRIQKKPFVLFRKNNHKAKENSLPEPITMLTAVKTKLALFRKKNHKAKENSLPEPIAMLTAIKTKLAEKEENTLEELMENRKRSESVEEPVQLPKSEIFKELEKNLEIATAPWSGKLTLFQTTFWDTDNVKAEPLLADFREEITQVYIDIRLANSIVWLSNEVGHRSIDLDESYKQLCVKIAERLQKVISSPEKIK